MIIGLEKVFVVGVDIKEMSEKIFVEMFFFDYFGDYGDVINKICKLIIVVVLGYVLGGGCELVMMCDFIIVLDIVKFG